MSALLYEKNGLIGTLTINRPEMRNALGEPGDGDLFTEASAKINADSELRCVILTGVGTAFSAGGNVKAMRDKAGVFAGTPEQIRDSYKSNIHKIVRGLWHVEVPMIAAINGPAIGLGNDVACLADIRIASKFAVFGATFLKIGLVPGDGGAWLLPRMIGLSRAAELFFTGETIDAATALDWGLVSRIVPPEMLMEEAQGLAAEIARQPPGVLRMTKKLMRESLGADLETIMDMSAAFQSKAHTTEDHAEALSAFFEKREPVFKGR
ncbi:MAG: crotonase/enoyl-CoA hydratase family protein [Alphaproteobacteria bacterium]|nr:crotonase/enoyl-CoA hydratase family protein [Alphaproteobacteria bacterium]MDE2111416.1 crotonase/enoyl-CoA hydratase family protein [Alphaproteobacteria bacterium]MDE2495531.1 crotonase/enoyl-CoA hydratase family protein [Alphaproteobacteria bacterium]